MAKNVQIVPLSGSLDFQPVLNEGGIKLSYDNGVLTTATGSTTLMTVDSTNSVVSIDNNANLKIPVKSSNPAGAATGDIWFNSSDNKFYTQGNSGVIQGGGPKGDTGAEGAQGPTGPIGPSR
jgi:hypothetical protein